MMRKRIALALAVLSLLACLTFLFSRGSNPPEQPAEPLRQISLYHYFSGSLSGGVTEMVNTVNNTQNQYQVVAQALDHEAFKTMIHHTLDTGDPPELFSYWAGSRTATLVEQDQLEPLGDFWSSSHLDDRFPQAIITAAATYDNERYLLPITQHIVVFFYNKALFDKHDLSPPSTWQEFTSLCAQLAEKGVTPIALGARERWPAQFWFDYLLLRTVGPDYRQALLQGQAKYTDPQVVDAARTWTTLLQSNYFNDNPGRLDWAEATELVCQGDAAMTLMGTWAMQQLANEPCSLEEETGFDYFPFPVIDPDIAYTSVGPIDGLVLTKHSNYPELAKSVLAYFAESKPQQLMSEGSGALAPSLAVPAEFYSPFKQRLLQEINKSEEWAFAFDLATPPDIAEKGLDSFAEIIEFPGQFIDILVHLQAEVEAFYQTPVTPEE